MDLTLRSVVTVMAEEKNKKRRRANMRVKLIKDVFALNTSNTFGYTNETDTEADRHTQNIIFTKQLSR